MMQSQQSQYAEMNAMLRTLHFARLERHGEQAPQQQQQ
eukprot:CAMPEP_0197599716 /NCGR_PEP_ID=MMETSP1326-20131121/31973_1 /TAXON_ID=1155430 /ORGANISM="Genus nov. species nov., Strain RCC2288" /LENGTH=37 /DNA_ID= /DNA_START= /DNA_END= /DNA_ORIENTATION=